MCPFALGPAGIDPRTHRMRARRRPRVAGEGNAARQPCVQTLTLTTLAAVWQVYINDMLKRLIYIPLAKKKPFPGAQLVGFLGVFLASASAPTPAHACNQPTSNGPARTQHAACHCTRRLVCLWRTRVREI